MNSKRFELERSGWSSIKANSKIFKIWLTRSLIHLKVVYLWTLCHLWWSQGYLSNDYILFFTSRVCLETKHLLNFVIFFFSIGCSSSETLSAPLRSPPSSLKSRQTLVRSKQSPLPLIDSNCFFYLCLIPGFIWKQYYQGQFSLWEFFHRLLEHD